MHPQPRPPRVEALIRVLEDAAPGDLGPAALVQWPESSAAVGQAICKALAARGVLAIAAYVPESVYRQPEIAVAAAGWVPAPSPALLDLIVLSGTRPWSESFDGDYRIEIQAMENREALQAAGHRIVFIEWPRGARRDAEVDLNADAMAAVFERALDADLDTIRAWNARLHGHLEAAREVSLRCPAGTDLRLSVAGRRFIREDCLLSAAEPVIYLPGGEIYAPAVETSANGVVAFRHCGRRRFARFEAGLLCSVTDEAGAEDAELAEELGVGVEPLCELGFGTNPWAPPYQIGALYEKSAGTAHVAVGGNAHFGGQRHSPRHADLIIRDPAVTVDGAPLELPPPLWAKEPPL
ncbi:MAG: hypothetical protein R3F39_13255 [Myxococcota bacterium]